MYLGRIYIHTYVHTLGGKLQLVARQALFTMISDTIKRKKSIALLNITELEAIWSLGSVYTNESKAAI